MAPSNNPKSKVCKRKKDVMDLTQKLKILDLLRQGEKVATIARRYGVNELTIRSIRNNEDKIRKSFSNLGSSTKHCKISRGGMISIFIRMHQICIKISISKQLLWKKWKK